MSFRIELTSPIALDDGNCNWFQPRAGVIPPGEPGNPSARPLVVMTLQKYRTGSWDTFYTLHEMRTADWGRTWTAPELLPTFERQPLGKRWEILVCDFTPKWHAASKRLLGTGHTVVYENDEIVHVRPRSTAYAVYDAPTQTWNAWEKLEMPDEPRFANCGAGCSQRVDLPNGDILLPVYFKEPEQTLLSSTVVRCSFDGQSLKYLEHGTECTLESGRGLYEPSLTFFDGRFFLTLRNDERAYVATSSDGLTFGTPVPWTWDDGSDLGSYNTQQHWITHRNGLFLAYTRRGAANDHVPRHRAPLFIAQVDPKQLRILRSTERILMPERGASLGNFSVVDVEPGQTWVTDSELMINTDRSKHAGDGSVWNAKILWEESDTPESAHSTEARSRS